MRDNSRADRSVFDCDVLLPQQHEDGARTAIGSPPIGEHSLPSAASGRGRCRGGRPLRECVSARPGEHRAYDRTCQPPRLSCSNRSEERATPNWRLQMSSDELHRRARRFKALCASCRERKARFKYRGEVRADRDHPPSHSDGTGLAGGCFAVPLPVATRSIAVRVAAGTATWAPFGCTSTGIRNSLLLRRASGSSRSNSRASSGDMTRQSQIPLRRLVESPAIQNAVLDSLDRRLGRAPA